MHIQFIIIILVYTKSYFINTDSNRVWFDEMDLRHRTGAFLYGYNNKKIKLWTSSVPYHGKKISTHYFIIVPYEYSIALFDILLVASTLCAGLQPRHGRNKIWTRLSKTRKTIFVLVSVSGLNSILIDLFGEKQIVNNEIFGMF